jgi:FkbM family methyltransferase
MKTTGGDRGIIAAVNLSGISRQTVLGQLLRAPLALIPKNAVLPILQGPLRGKLWTVGSATHGCWLGSYEFAKQRMFSETLRPGDVVFDIGANVGFYSLLAAVRIGTTGRVYAFEPLPRNLGFLRRNLDLNRIGNVEILDAAVAAQSGVAAFDVGGGPCLGRVDAAGTLAVRAVSIDALVSSGELPPPSVIKMDIEGGELAALEGARATLERHRPMVFLATHGDAVHRASCALLEAAGYELRPVDERPLSETDEVMTVPRTRP